MTKSSARRFAAAALVGLAFAQGAAMAAEPLRVTKPVHATKENLDPLRTYSAPFLLVHPDNPKLIVGGFHEFRSKQCGLMRSTDGGETWKILDANPALQSYPFCLANNSNIFQAPLAWGRNNTLYMATVAWDTQDTRSKTSIAVARSTNLGDSWTTVIARDNRPTQGEDQESDRPVTGLVVDTESGNDDIVYVSYRQGFPNASAPNARPQQPALSISRDGGRTFAPPVSAIGVGPANAFENPALRNQAMTSRTTVPSDPSATTTTTAVPPPDSRAAKPDQAANFGAAGNGHGLTLDDKGNVYLAWMSTSANMSPSTPSALMVSKSTDQGKTWTSQVARPPGYDNRQNPRMVWTPEGGGDGTLHIVYEWNNQPSINSYADIAYIRSTDGAKTWSQPKRLTDDDAAQLAGKYLPNIQVAPNGRIDVVWWDTRDDPGIRANDVYYTYSTDNGNTWAKNIRITDQTIDRRFGVWGINFDQNSPPSLASVDQYAVIAWDDTRFSRGEDGVVVATDPVTSGVGVGGGIQDIFVSVAQFSAVGGGTSKAAKLVLAGVVGLVAVGLILLVVALAGRRGAGGPPRAPKTTTKPPAGVPS